jgi:AbrB family looped-hinge helix DNA binding protein
MSGFSESAKTFAGQDPVLQVRVGPDGRILIPAELRRAAGLEPGATVAVTLQGGELRLSTPSARLRRIQAIAARHVRPGVGVVDSFLADKRAEAVRE